ncbi:coiled-coil domain-containing protein 39-like isoform X2 [Paralichthys olivaceus]|uniref:coiled-coil domain-containing protein 39-like isoform X2 n=1 Tax=Paralichthys olivaceus TaxID=8255 RepID=UPI003753CF14
MLLDAYHLLINQIVQDCLTSHCGLDRGFYSFLVVFKMDPTLSEQTFSVFSNPKKSNFCQNMKSFELQDWNNHGYIPAANAETKALMEEIGKKEAKLVQLENKLESHKDQMEVMDEFIKNAEEEQQNTEALRKANEREVDSAKHLTALTKRNADGQSLNMTKMEKALRSFAETRNMLENRKHRTYQKLGKFRKLMNRDQQTMDGFLEESTRKHEDLMAIMKYSEQDEKTIKSLTLETEKKTMEANEKRKLRDKELTETLSAQFALDKATKNFQQNHLETQRLIHQWEKTIKLMNQRDSENHQCALYCAEVNQKERDRNAIITEKKYLHDIQQNNMEIEKKISAKQRQAVKLQQNLKEVENNCSALKDELDGIKGEQDKSYSCVKSEMSNRSRKNKMIQDKDEKLKEARAYNAELEEKLEQVTQTALSEEERAAQMDQVRRDKEKATTELDFQLHDCQEKLFRRKAHLQALKTKEKDFVAHVARSKSDKSQKSQLKEQEDEIIRQQIVLTEQDSKLINLETKLARLQGDVKLDETQVLQMKIVELTKVLEEKKSANILTNMLKESEYDIPKLKKEIEKYEAQKRNVTEKVEELSLFCNITEKEMKACRLKRQDNMVEHNILKVEVKRIRDLLFSKTDTVLSLEKRKLGLQRALKEREGEIKVYREMLGQKLKISEKERQKLSAELSEKLAKIKGLRDHFEIQKFLLAAPDEDVEKWQIHCITKAALEKEELKREGDALYDKMDRVKLENKALVNTNYLFINSVSAFQESLKRKIESGPEYQEKLQLDKQLKAAEDALQFKKKYMGELQQDLQDMNDTFESLLQQERVEKDKMKNKQSLINLRKKEITSEQEKIDRAKKQCSKLIKQIRSAKNTTVETFEETEIKLKELKDFIKSFDKMLSETVVDKPDLRSVLEQYSLQVSCILSQQQPQGLNTWSLQVPNCGTAADMKVTSPRPSYK